MLTKKQREQMYDMDNLSPSEKRVIRKRILDKGVNAVEDLILILENSDKFPNIRKTFQQEKFEKLINTYFQSLGINVKYCDPYKVIELMDENTVLMRKIANSQQELANTTHQIEYFKYLYSHIIQLMEANDTRNVKEVVSTP